LQFCISRTRRIEQNKFSSYLLAPTLLRIMACRLMTSTRLAGRCSSHASSRSSIQIPSFRLTSSRIQAQFRPHPIVSSFSTSVKMASETRTETDAFGPLQVEKSRYWGVSQDSDEPQGRQASPGPHLLIFL
jgi:hypothetical protein